jgi:dolichyl-diphosphooligosaccharide--protein glycosyltransferase
MKLPEAFSKEGIAKGLKSGLGKLRIKVNHDSLMTIAVLLLILFVAFAIRILPMRWEIQVAQGQAGEIHLSEFDPYYQYSLTRYMVQNGILSPYWPKPWIDRYRWYPDGIDMSRSLPGLPMTAAILYDIISALGINVDLMSFCAFFPALMGTLACLIIYFLGKDMGGKTIGMFAAFFLALTPSYIQRTSLGFFDDETLGIVALLLFAVMFLRANDEDRPIGSVMKYSIGSALALALFCSDWGAAYYPIGLTALFVFVLILIRRYTQRLLLSYSITFGMGLFLTINIPYLSPTYLTSSAILPVAGVFILLLLSEIVRNLTSARSKVLFVAVFLIAIVGTFVLISQLGFMEAMGGKFLSVLDPFIRAASPIVESVAEHRISAWGSIYYEFGITIVFFIAGVYFTMRNLNNRNLFLVIFGITALYFASSMVRLLVLLAPAFALLASIGVFGVLKPFSTLLREPPKIVTKAKYGLQHVGKEFSGIAVFLIFIILMTNFAFAPQSGGIPKVYSQSYAPVTVTAGSLPIAPAEPVREWLDMLEWTRNNLAGTTVVCSWWDYGYWLTLLGNVTSLADNATINTTQIENIGLTFMANETQSLKMLAAYNAKYILVFVTLGQDSQGNWGMLGYGDEGKWMWMARISGKARQRFLDAGFLTNNTAWDDESTFGKYDNSTNKWVWNDAGTNSTIYKLMSWGEQRWCGQNSATAADVGVQPTYFKEAFFSGLDLTTANAGSNYGGIVPLVCLYEIDWAKYYADYPSGT